MITLTSDPGTALSVANQTIAQRRHRTRQALPTLPGGNSLRGSRRIRRGPSRVQKAIVAAGCVLLLAGCGGGNTSSEANKLPTPTSSGTAPQPGARSGPRLGQCHLVSQHALQGETFDTSKPVPCSHRHNAETAGIHPVFGASGVPDKATLQSYATGDCGYDASNYLHATAQMIDRMSVLAVPTKSSAGNTVVRCDVVVLRTDGNNSYGSVGMTRTSIRHQVASGQLASWHLCINQPLSQSFPLADCTKPHRGEALFHTIALHLNNDRYPSGGTDHNTRGDAACRHAVAKRPDAHRLAVHSHWTSRSYWESQQKPPTLEGVCWFWRTDGKNLPPVH